MAMLVGATAISMVPTSIMAKEPTHRNFAKKQIQVYNFPDNDSCGSWSRNHRNANSSDQAYDGWVLGFVSGLNFFGDNNGNIDPGVTSEGILNWITLYCSENPLDSITQASVALSNELKKRNKMRQSH